MNAPELWTAREIASWLMLSARHVAERLVHESGFPAPAIGGKKFGRKRWFKDDVIRWAGK